MQDLTPKPTQPVIAGLDPAIHGPSGGTMDARIKSGHDGGARLKKVEARLQGWRCFAAVKRADHNGL
jgi:hypothetical protein